MNRKNIAVNLLKNVVPYLAFLILLMPDNLTGIFSMLCLSIIGGVLIISKKLDFSGGSGCKESAILSAFISSYYGVCFYNRWITSSKLQAVAEKLHISSGLMIAVAAAFLAILGFCFLASILRKWHGYLRGSTDRYLILRDIICCLAMSLVTTALMQVMIDTGILTMGMVKFILGVLIVAVFTVFVYCITGMIRTSVVSVTGIFMILSTANAYVYSFRTRLLEPIDIFSVETAMNVSDSYSLLPIPLGIILGWAVWAVSIVYIFSACPKKLRIALPKRSAVAVCCLVGILLIRGYTANLKTYHWHKNGAEINGYVLDFVAKFKEVNVKKPSGYSDEHVAELSNKYTAHSKPDTTEEKTPHIIVIMNEAFSDLNVLGEISVDKEVTPFIRSLRENTVSGFALASVYSGNTANSEYEFLTGNSMAWLSPNAVPYQQYIKSPVYSMPSYLKMNSQYRCVAIHPFHSDGWNRPVAYENLGFDEWLFIENFPQKSYVRKYISDREMFEKIVELYEESENPLFLFGTSMQNHGGYKYNGKNFKKTISLVGYEAEYPDVEQYLSLIHETDKAVEYLISYFSETDEDVVIVFFGDHQPNVGEAFYKELGNDASASEEELQARYKVPFFIWANYDIEEQYVEHTSLNYLSTYVYKVAGISLPPYNRFLSEMENVIPSINANGFYSAQSQRYLPFEDASDAEQEWLNSYEYLQYNSFAEKKRNTDMFPFVK